MDGVGGIPKKTEFVTVGATSFDTLVKTADSEQVNTELFKKGYAILLIQMGRGSHIAPKVLDFLPSLWIIVIFSILNFLRRVHVLETIDGYTLFHFLVSTPHLHEYAKDKRFYELYVYVVGMCSVWLLAYLCLWHVSWIPL